MTKITKIMTAASALGVLGIVALPVASYADTAVTDVSVTITEECQLGDGSTSATNHAADELTIGFGAGADAQIASGGGGADDLNVICNQAWNLSEATSDTSLLAEVAGAYTGAPGFAAISSNVTTASPAVGDLATWGDNTWGMVYTGSNLTTAGAAWHGPATGAGTLIASGAATGGNQITQYFGAKTNGSVAAGTYGAIITYTLAEQP